MMNRRASMAAMSAAILGGVANSSQAEPETKPAKKKAKKPGKKQAKASPKKLIETLSGTWIEPSGTVTAGDVVAIYQPAAPIGTDNDGMVYFEIFEGHGWNPSALPQHPLEPPEFTGLRSNADISGKISTSPEQWRNPNMDCEAGEMTIVAWVFNDGQFSGPHPQEFEAEEE